MKCCNHDCSQGRNCVSSEPKNLAGALVGGAVLLAFLALVSWIENTGAF